MEEKEDSVEKKELDLDSGLKNRINRMEKILQSLVTRVFHIENHLTDLNEAVKNMNREAKLEFQGVKSLPKLQVQRPVQEKTYDNQPNVEEQKAIEPVIGQKITTKHLAETYKSQEKQINIPNQQNSQKIKLETQSPLSKYNLKQKTKKSASEYVPYFLLFAFYLLLSVTVYVTTQFLFEVFADEIVTSLMIFIYIFAFSTLFIIAGYVVYQKLKKKGLTLYFIFPQSFVIVGIIGYFLSFILPVSDPLSTSNYLIWGLSIGALIIILIFIIIKLYNEFFIGECYLFIILLIFTPLILDSSFFGAYTNIIMTCLFIGVILVGLLLSLKGISFTPTIITLVTLSIMSLVSFFALNVSIIIVLLTFAGFSVSWVSNREISFKSNFYSNKISQVVVFYISQILPNIGIYVLLIKRDFFDLPIWDLILSAFIIQFSYFVLNSTQKKHFGKFFKNSKLDFFKIAVFINILFQLFLITSTRIIDINPYEKASFSVLWLVSLIGAIYVSKKQNSGIHVLILAVLIPFMILFHNFSSNIYLPIIFLLLSSLSLSWVQFKNYGTKEYSFSILKDEKFIIIAQQVIMTFSLSVFLFQGRSSDYTSLEYFVCIFFIQLVQFFTINKRIQYFESKFSKSAVNGLIFITFGVNMIQIFFGAVSEIMYSEDFTSTIFISFTLAYFILSFLPLFGAKFLSNASNITKISFQGLGLVLSQILFIINVIILPNQEYAVLFYAITIGHLLMGTFLPLIFPKSKELRIFSFELLILVVIDLLIIKTYYNFTLPWLNVIKIIVFLILSVMTIFYSVIYYLHQSQKKSIRLFKEWGYSKIFLAVHLVINAILTIIYRDMLIFSILIITLIVAIVFTILSIRFYQITKKAREEHYFILIFAAIVYVICAFSSSLYEGVFSGAYLHTGFLILLITSFLLMMTVSFVVSSNSWFETTGYLIVQFLITNHLLRTQDIDILQWIVLGFYGITSVIFLYKSCKYNSNPVQEIIFSEINIIWALHFYIKYSNDHYISNWILVPVLLLMFVKIYLEKKNTQKSIDSKPQLNSQSRIKKTVGLVNLQILINIAVFAYLSYIVGVRLEISQNMRDLIWIQYFLFMIFFSVNVALYPDSRLKNLLVIISPMLIFILEIIMRLDPTFAITFANYFFFILSVVYAAIFLMNSHQKNKENKNKILLLIEIYFVIILSTISCLLTDFSPEIKFGFIFVFILLTLYLNIMFNINKARIFQVFTIVVIGLSYVVYVVINAGRPGFEFASLFFLLVGIGLILGSFIKYRSNLEDMNKISTAIDLN
ncbi:hypothetical protein DSAG12_00126 [Promethearchaeum syntrophicum]|uniref:Uncharacterized protein n=1 Tax=Promethearchaeum syntrophicum TaxID=2594042 RepID=A0A5B9D5D2_9ARCH|nr:hypothetical protein [Candidatus Prometheoarchaeum syntrophicum]QEE14314.1 hypothetical protein DSAG12_00126 [Candidatus Prometheoarchaeum syntrophicum]